MSKSILTIKRKTDGKILTDVVNDACQVHNIYDGHTLLLSAKEWEIGYCDWEGFSDVSDFEEVKK